MNEDSSNPVFLATTALEDFWDTTKPVVFLGDWCLRESRRSVWQPLNGEVLPGIWKDKKRFLDAYLYLQDVYERLLRQMAALLDEVHGEAHDIRYWRIVVGPWLFQYLDILYDRYLTLQAAQSKYPFFDTIVLSEDSFITPRSTFEFVSLSQDDPYNLQIYSRIFSAKQNHFRQKSTRIERKTPPSRRKNFLSLLLKELITTCMSRLAMAEADKTVYLVEPYFPKILMIKLFFKTKGKVKFLLPSREELPVAAPNQNMRDRFKKISLNHDAFEKLIVQLLPYDIPCVFLESYKAIQKESFRYPHKPPAIVSWMSWHYNERFKIWAASAAEAGSSLYGVQHGGNYGIDQYMKVLDHEVAITDKFYSWGWNSSAVKERIVPMPATKIIGNKRYKKNKENKNILFAGANYSRYFMRMEYPNTMFMAKYCDDQIRFLKSVDLRYQPYIRYRAFVHDYGLDIVKRIQNACPGLVIEGWDVPFQKSLMNCKLFVCDHLSTVHAEALSLNVPTLLFWDPESYIHTTEASRCLENLHAVGILHYSPESAAGQVKEVYENVDAWWHERKRQSMRLEFCDRFAKSSPNPIDEWLNEFKKISG